MLADGLTKALSTAKHEPFVVMISIEDQKDRLAFIKKEENLRDALQRRQADSKFSEAFGYGAHAS